jgi:hypothetical protein
MFTNQNTNNDNEHFLISFIQHLMQYLKSYTMLKQKNLSKYACFKISFDIRQ